MRRSFSTGAGRRGLPGSPWPEKLVRSDRSNRRRAPGSAAGYTTVEVLIVVGIVMTLSTAVTMQYRATLDILDADVAIGEVASQMRYARHLSLDQRRNVQIDFVAPSTIRVVRINAVGDTTVMTEATLPGAYSFALPGAAVGVDTPDGFGGASAVDFGMDGEVARTGGMFLPDGTFVEAAGGLLNGTVFTMGAADMTARAATLSGSSGRIRRYQWTGAWEAQ